MNNIQQIRDKSDENKRTQLYQAQLLTLASPIDKNTDQKGKIKALYQRLVRYMHYDYACLERIHATGTTFPSVFVRDGYNVPEVFRNYGTTAMPQTALIHTLGLCAALAQIFQDLCCAANVFNCGLVYGETALAQHVWNYSRADNGEKLYTDLTYGIYAKDGFGHYEPTQIDCFCLADKSQLLTLSPRTITDHQAIKAIF